MVSQHLVNGLRVVSSRYGMELLVLQRVIIIPLPCRLGQFLLLRRHGTQFAEMVFGLLSVSCIRVALQLVVSLEVTPTMETTSGLTSTAVR